MNISLTQYGLVIGNVQSWTYPGGEVGVRVDMDKSQALVSIDITAKISDSNGIMALLLVADAMKRQKISLADTTLYLPYMPYARQDRVAVSGDPYSIRVFASLIDSLGVARIWTLDPHSPISEAVFHNTHVDVDDGKLYAATFIEKTRDLGNSILIVPDEGAMKRVRRIADLVKLPVALMSKKRDPDTGKLEGFELLSGDVQGKTCFVIDDICDGGGTFLGISSVLKEHNAGEQHLFVTHGIFSQGCDKLFESFDSIGCTNSFRKAADYDNRVHVQHITYS